MIKLWHTSDIHLSFKPDGSVQKPMDQRQWSIGSQNYVGYLGKLSAFGVGTIQPTDFVCITGDLTHDMKHAHAMKQIEWIRNNTCGIIILIKGNHDRYINFGALRIDSLPSNVHLLDEGEIITIGPYTFGCYSDHDQKTEGDNHTKYMEMAQNIVDHAKTRETIPVMLSHYPLPIAVAKWVSQIGLKAYLSGHVHCTKGSQPDGNCWNWYNEIAKPTDDVTLSDCYFSTGTTDVLLNRIGQIYKEIKHLGVNSPLNTKSTNSLKDKAGKAFGCNQKFINKFDDVDPFNPGNTIAGFLCRSKGVMHGSLYITHVNSIEVEPQLVFGTPKLAYPYKDATNEYMDFPKAKWYYLAEKWNGTNVLFYKYYDSKGQMFMSAKTKGTATLKDSEFGPFFSLTLEALGTTVPWGEVPNQLMPLMYDSYQSMSFELCGKKEPHLVKYDFDIALKPLFYTREYGGLVPYLDPLNSMPVPFHFNYSDYVGSCCRSSQERDYVTNEEYRKANNLPHKYEYEHFAVEGKVLYLLDENGNCIDRTLYKIKSKDIEEVHWQTFNAQMQEKVHEAIKKIGRDELEVNEVNLAEELDMGPKEWGKWGKDIMRFSTSNPAENKKELLVLVGVPGSGKSTFAKQLEPLGWVRVNQDDLGSRNKCKELVVKSFKENKKVCIDRCNFDVNQRKAWLDLAKEYNCKAVSAIVFDTPHALCKDRIMQRTDHPTIAPVEGSKVIIDKFAAIFVDITPEEGFQKTMYVNTEEMVKNLLETYGAPTK